MFLFHKLDLFRTFNIESTVLATFLTHIEAGYQKSNAYHNALHAADVVSSFSSLLSSPCTFSLFCSFTYPPTTILPARWVTKTIIQVQSVYFLIKQESAASLLSPMDILSTLLSAAIHGLCPCHFTSLPVCQFAPCIHSLLS
jgi:hypothetical protein